MPNFKTKRWEDKKYLIAERDFPCIFTNSSEVEVDHLCKGTNRGAAYKAHDYWTNPLHHSIHREKHNQGEITTFLKYFNEYPLTMMDGLKALGEMRYLRYLVKNGRKDEAIELLS